MHRGLIFVIRNRWQGKTERGLPSGFTLHPDPASMRFNDFTSNGKSHAGAWNAVSDGGATVEFLKNQISFRLRNAGSSFEMRKITKIIPAFAPDTDWR